MSATIKNAFVFSLIFSAAGPVNAAMVNASFDGTITKTIIPWGGYNQYYYTVTTVDWYTINLSGPTTLSIDVTRTSNNLSPALALFSYDPVQDSASLMQFNGTNGQPTAAINMGLGNGQYALAVGTTELKYLFSSPQYDYSELIYEIHYIQDHSSGGNYHINFAGDGIAVVATVPLPASVWLLWSGVASLVLVGRKMRSTMQKT